MMDAFSAVSQFSMQVCLCRVVNRLAFRKDCLNARRFECSVRWHSHSSRNQHLAICNHRRHALGVSVSAGVVMRFVVHSVLMSGLGALLTRNDLILFNRQHLEVRRLAKVRMNCDAIISHYSNFHF
jgi:hypothetical protein